MQIGKGASIGAFIEIEIYPNPEIRGVPGVAIGGEHAGVDPAALGFEFSRPGGLMSMGVSPRGMLNSVSQLVAQTEAWLREKGTAQAGVRQ